MKINNKNERVRKVFFLKEIKCSGNGMAIPIVAGCGFCITEKFSWLKNTTAQIQHQLGDKRFIK
jgi:hypothetical protein